MSRSVEAQANDIVKLFEHGPVNAWAYSVPVLKRAIQLEQQRRRPRILLVSLLQGEIARQERDARRAPKDAA